MIILNTVSRGFGIVTEALPYPRTSEGPRHSHINQINFILGLNETEGALFLVKMVEKPLQIRKISKYIQTTT